MKPPRDFQTLKTLIIERKPELPKRLAQVAVFALDNPDEIAFGTAASIAERSGVQPSTLVRFSQAIGYEGFTDLQAVFRERLRERGSSYEDRLETIIDTMGENGVNKIFSGVIAAASASIDGMISRVPATIFEESVKLLAGAQTIYLLAQRRSFPVTTYMSYMLGKMKVRSVLVSSPFGVEPELMEFATKNDAALAISFAPYSSGTVDHARILERAGVPIISITDSAFSPLTPMSKLWFEIVESDFAGFRSITATMTLANAIAIGIGEERRRLRLG
ncbi:MAG: MurR/RpiR family transcriptional regulator [Rhizobiaceae bacterium]